jgi:hypothetical protein
MTMTANISPIASLDLKRIDSLLFTLQGYVEEVKAMKMQFQTYKPTPFTNTISNHTTITDTISIDTIPTDAIPTDAIPTDTIPIDMIPTDIRLKFQNRLHLIIKEAQSILKSWEVPVRLAREDEPKSTSRRSVRRSNGAPLVQMSSSRLSSRPKSKRRRKSNGSIASSMGRISALEKDRSQNEKTQSEQVSSCDDEADETGTAQDHTEDETAQDNGENDIVEEAMSGIAEECHLQKNSEPNNTTSMVDHLSFAVPTYECKLSDLGPYTVPTLEKFTSLADVKRTGMCHLRIKDFSSQDLNLDPCSVQTAKYTTAQIKYNTATLRKPGVMVISPNRAGRPTASMPTFTDTLREEYSDCQLRDSFESFCRHDTKSQYYLIGPSKDVLGNECHYSDLLTAGPYLHRSLNGTIEGINKSYIYASYSTGQTATAIHSEDCAWFSVNLVLVGAPKLWLSVEPASNEKFEAGLNDLFPGQLLSCSQRIRHLSMLLAPSVLDRLDVKYHIKACYPG